jgi:hypothetical protein
MQGIIFLKNLGYNSRRRKRRKRRKRKRGRRK